MLQIKKPQHFSPQKKLPHHAVTTMLSITVLLHMTEGEMVTLSTVLWLLFFFFFSSPALLKVNHKNKAKFEISLFLSMNINAVLEA